jgi:quercetin dioxygenase-like cupin family protein
MNPKSYCQLALAIGITIFLAACNGNDSKVLSSTTDSTASMETRTDTVPASENQTAMDAAKVAPGLYKVLVDSLGIRILEATYKPGDSSAMHSHPESAMYVLEGGTSLFTDNNGKATRADLKTGMSDISPAETHSVKNIGKNTTRVLLVEINRQDGSAASDASMDAIRIAPKLYTVLNDSMGIRVLQVSYKPGESSAMHSHPDAALYVIEGGTTEFTDDKGNKQTYTLKPGTAMVMAGGTHSVKNVGKTTTKSILFEVNRARK